MPRPPRPSAVTRLNLELSTQTRTTLQRLQKRTDADSLAQVIRTAIVLYDTLLTRKEEGAKLLLEDSRGERELVILELQPSQ